MACGTRTQAGIVALIVYMMLRAFVDVRNGSSAAAQGSTLSQPSRGPVTCEALGHLVPDRCARHRTALVSHKRQWCNSGDLVVLFEPDRAWRNESYISRGMGSPMRTMRLAQARPCLAARRPVSLQTSFLAPSPTGRMFQSCSGAAALVLRCVGA
jgi:hypothetical protein